MNKTETLKAISELIEECKKNPMCKNCTFYNSHDERTTCLIDSEDAPGDWGISQESEEI